jgi:hypothetical protein
MGMKKSQPFQPADSSPELTQGWNDNRLVIAKDHGLNSTFAVDKKTDLTIELKGKLGDEMGQFKGNNLGGIDMATKDKFEFF